MDYYEKKKRALSKVDELYSNGVSNEIIEYKISLLFGFGKKFVTERIELLKCISKKE